MAGTIQTCEKGDNENLYFRAIVLAWSTGYEGQNQWQGDQVRSYFSSSGNRRLEPNQGDS